MRETEVEALLAYCQDLQKRLFKSGGGEGVQVSVFLSMPVFATAGLKHWPLFLGREYTASNIGQCLGFRFQGLGF